jgi:hypothetical protein
VIAGLPVNPRYLSLTQSGLEDGPPLLPNGFERPSSPQKTICLRLLSGFDTLAIT